MAHLKFNPKKHSSVKFTGMCAVVWYQKEKTVEVLLVDVEQALKGDKENRADPHFPALAVPEDPNLVREGLEPDVVVSVDGSPREHAVWSLKNASVVVAQAGGKQSGAGSVDVDDRAVKGKAAKKDGNAWSSIRLLLDLLELSNADPAILKDAPIHGRVKFDSGHLQCMIPPAPIAAKRYNFIDNGKKIFSQDRRIAIECEVIFTGARSLQLSRGGKSCDIVVPVGLRATVTNGCACAPAPDVDHYMAYYKLVNAKRKPKLVKPDFFLDTFPYTIDPCDPRLVRLP